MIPRFRYRVGSLDWFVHEASVRGQSVSERVTSATGLGLVASSIWTGHVSGTSVIDYGSNGHNLTLANGATGNNAATGLVPGNGITEKYLNFGDDTTQRAVASLASIGQYDGTESKLFVELYQFPSAPTGLRTLFGNRESSSPFHGFELQTNSTSTGLSCRHTVDVSGNLDDSLVDAGLVDTAWGLAMHFIDRNDGTTPTAGIHTDEGPGVGPDAVAAGDDSVGSVAFAIGSGRVNAAGHRCAALFLFEGTQVEGINLTTLATNLMGALVA